MRSRFPSQLNLTLLFFLSLLAAIPLPSLAESPAPQGPTVLGRVNGAIGSVLFFDIAQGSIQVKKVDTKGYPIIDEETGEQAIEVVGFPFLVAVLVLGAVFFTFFYGWINVRGFKHAIDIVRGKFDKEEDEGEITHFRALTSALSATVGLGNIAGVAVAIQLGGPGAVFWMMFLAIFGMSAKFSSCTLAQMYRKVNSNGTISGGPMYYLDIGLREVSPYLKPLGKALALLYAVFIMGGSIGGGNMFQSNQTAEAFTSTFGLGESANAVVGIILAILVAVVILGGIKRIGAATSKIVPLMCGLYVIASLIVIITHLPAIPSALSTIVLQAFTDNAFFGGMVGVLIMGFKRAAFSNEAGLGSAAIAHAAAKTKEPVREGLVAMLGPFIDTIVICLMTSMVIVVTGVYADPALSSGAGNLGVTLTNAAFATVIPWFPYVLTICIGLFAYSTMISWCYYGERGWIYLLDHLGNDVGLKTLPVFRLIFVFFTFFGSINSLTDVIDFSDLMILSLAFPNIIGSIILAPRVRAKLKDYMRRHKEGAFQ
ncbi:MAG: alanine:cation symporter family protein [Bdellovibrionales bacterium]|nr:alanine:cation symporter family protein [Bdellovibrionales bacterium]